MHTVLLSKTFRTFILLYSRKIVLHFNIYL